MRLIDCYITQLKAQGPARTCNESKEEESLCPQLEGLVTCCLALASRSLSRSLSSTLKAVPTPVDAAQEPAESQGGRAPGGRGNRHARFLEIDPLTRTVVLLRASKQSIDCYRRLADSVLAPPQSMQHKNLLSRKVDAPRGYIYIYVCIYMYIYVYVCI